MSWDLKKSWEDGLRIQVGKRLTTGPLLRLLTYADTVNGLSDRGRLADYVEVEIAGINGAPSTYVLASTLMDWPQILVGYQEDGLPALLGTRKSLEGNGSIIGRSRSGKSVQAAVLEYQAVRHGYSVLVLGHKKVDLAHYATLRAATDSITDENGNAAPLPFRFATFEPGVRTSGFNYLEQEAIKQGPEWLRAARMILAFSKTSDPSDPAQAFFDGQSRRVLSKTPWGSSFQDLDANIQKSRLNRDVQYATAAARDQIALLASIEQQNLPGGHPANVDLEWLIRNRGSLYFEGCGLEVGGVAGAGCALVTQALLSVKRRIDPMGKSLVFLMIDEAQEYPRALLRRLVEQCAGLGIRLILMFHTLEQLGQDWETISMTGVRMFFSAVAGGLTERHIQALFGTKKEYPMSFGNSESNTLGGSTGLATGGLYPITTTTETWQEQHGSQFGFSEKEDFVWKNNDTLWLNYNRSAFVLSVAPGAELAYFGPRAIKAETKGPPIPFDEINRLGTGLFEESPFTILPGGEQKMALSGPQAPEGTPRRAELIARLEKTAAEIRQALGFSNGSDL